MELIIWIVFAANALLMVSFAWKANVLLGKFRRKNPEIFADQVTFGASHWAHPDKAWFILGKRGRLLAEKDPELHAERRLCITLGYISITVPFLSFFGLLVLVFLQGPAH